MLGTVKYLYDTSISLIMLTTKLRNIMGMHHLISEILLSITSLPNDEIRPSIASGAASATISSTAPVAA